MGLRIGVDGRYLRDDHPGISRHLFEILSADGAAAGGAQLVVLHDPRVPGGRLDARALLRPGLELVCAPFAPRSLAEQVALPRLLRRLALDVFHAPYPFTALACPCPRVVTVHDVIALHPRHGLRPAPRRFLARALLRRVTRRAAAVLTPSHAARADAVAWLGLAPERVTVSGGAVSAAFRPAPRERVEALRATLGWPARFVLYVGTRQRHKNLDTLLEAWAQRPADDVTLVLAGGRAADVPALERRARAVRAAAVRVLGPIDEALLPALYTAAELFVLPSLDEGFGLPLLEAMACGTPVACAARGALPEVAGGAAALFDPHDVAGLGRTLERLLRDPAERAERARRGRQISRGTSWDSVAARTWSACRMAAARSSAVRPRVAGRGLGPLVSTASGGGSRALNADARVDRGPQA